MVIHIVFAQGQSVALILNVIQLSHAEMNSVSILVIVQKMQIAMPEIIEDTALAELDTLVIHTLLVVIQFQSQGRWIQDAKLMEIVRASMHVLMAFVRTLVFESSLVLKMPIALSMMIYPSEPWPVNVMKDLLDKEILDATPLSLSPT